MGVEILPMFFFPPWRDPQNLSQTPQNLSQFFYACLMRLPSCAAPYPPIFCRAAWLVPHKHQHSLPTADLEAAVEPDALHHCESGHPWVV